MGITISCVLCPTSAMKCMHKGFKQYNVMYLSSGTAELIAAVVVTGIDMSTSREP